MNKAYNATPQGQKDMCYAAIHTATAKGLADHITTLMQDRFALVKAWRDGGSTDALWADVEALDAIIDKQDSILASLMA